MAGIFISYRRADSSAISGRINDRLAAVFGEKNVFKDVDDIPMGSDFRNVLDRAVRMSSVLLVIIGPRWAESIDEAGRRRLDNPDDFVRIEVETSLKNANTRVIPVLVGGASMPTAEELPPTLHDLLYRNAAIVRDDPDFNRDMLRLIEQIRQSNTMRIVNRRKRSRALIAGIVAVLGIAVVLWGVNRFASSPTQTPEATEIVQLSSSTPTQSDSTIPTPSLTATTTATQTQPFTLTPSATLTSTATATPTVTLTKTRTPTRTPTPTATLPPEGIALLDVAPRVSSGYIPNSVDLIGQPLANIIEPNYQGSSQIYGELLLGQGQPIAVVFDHTEADAGQLYVDQNGDRDLTNDLPTYMIHGVESQLTVQLVYGDLTVPHTLNFYYSGSFNTEVGAFRLTYYAQTYRKGFINLGGIVYAIALDDSENDGRFDTMNNVYGSDHIFLDTNRDGEVVPYTGDLVASLVSPMEVAHTCYSVSSVTPDGFNLSLQSIPRGSVSGTVTNKATGVAIGGVKVTLGENTAVTDSSGHYQLSVCPGPYISMNARHPRYVPEEVDWQDLRDFINVYAEKDTKIDIGLEVMPDAPSGEVTLKNGESYHFLTGERSTYTGGEFYVYIEAGKVSFYANNDQRGVVLLGKYPNADLYQLTFCDIPESKYTPFGVDASVGSVYVALAHAGEEGNYVVFRVKSILLDAVVLEYVYRNYC